MRGASRRAEPVLAIALRSFAWEPALIATIRHATLPWLDSISTTIEIHAKALADLKELGARDRLSLVGQFAAHEALLQFAGAPDAELSIDEWAVVSRRGSDCRLLRIAARACSAIDAPPVLTTIEQFADAIRAPRLQTFRQSWARAETVYAEVLAALASDVAVDLTWLRGAARGEILPPGPEVLREIVAGATWSGQGDLRVADALRAMAIVDGRLQVIAIGGGSILQRYSSLGDMRRVVPGLDLMAESEIVERLVPAAAAKPIVLIVNDGEALDPASARVVQLASTVEQVRLMRLTNRPDERTWFVASTRLAARKMLDQRLRSCRDADSWLREFAGSPAYLEYLRNGALPPSDGIGVELPEPRRSYVAALALLGPSMPVAVARRYLEQFYFAGDLTDLVFPGLSQLIDDEYRFVSEDARSRVITLIPAASHAALYRVAARAARESGRPLHAARLLVEAGDAAAAVEILRDVAWSSADEAARELSAVPVAALATSHVLTRRLADALIDCGRYRDARDIAGHLPDALRELTLARADRQTGDYDAALERLRPLAGSCEADLLRAEILSIHRRSGEARELLASCMPASEDERVRAGYLLALLDENTDLSWQSSPSSLRDYYAARLDTYRAAANGEAARALSAVERSLASARTVIQRIDVLLDRMYVLFSAGRWPDARAAALDGLTLAEETQGDRAAGGFLFVIAYLAADDGQWVHAAQRIDRLRQFYSGTRDERRLDELALLSAHLDFSRGRFDDAARQAAVLLDPRHDAQIREAAALILDESNWILRRDTVLQSDGATENVELTDRHRLQRMRRGEGPQAFANPFIAALVAWERGGAMPVPRTSTEKLMMFRSALGRGDAVAAESVGREFGVHAPQVHATESRDAEQAILRAVAAGEFPFDERPLAGVAWRYASRNRLRQWQQIGSLAPIGQEEIDDAMERAGSDWITFSDRELLFIEGIGRWNADTRDAVIALFRTKAELSRLRRLLEQEEGDRPATEHFAAGIIGESTAIRDLLGLVTRVARRDVPICILGESGTGKELVARAIHSQSGRRSRPFTAINCAALPETLIESELFGHVRGAFTGADRDRAGVIESTDGGTLFLDEIGEMALTAQAKLLRFLQDGEFRRVGDTVNRTADVRIVAATNRKLESAVEEGRFREDLYYRIRGLEAVLPPLRERGRDIFLLASHFIAAEREKHRAGPSRLSAEAEAIFLAYNWPGNVRELQNTIRAAHAIAGEAREIDVDHLPERLRRIVAPRTTVSSYQDAVTRFRRDLIERSLVEAMGNQNRAASLLNISRQALAYQIRELGIMVNKPKKARAVRPEP